MKQTGIVICNYNKCQDVLNCIQSVLESRYTDFDLYVVDNASTDDSVEQITRRYGDRLTLLVNEENLGGSGGFNTGLRRILAAGYEYAVCLDNDILVDENAIGALADFLDHHPESGMVGSIVYHMEEPDYVQQYGLNLDFENYVAETLYANHPHDTNIPEMMYCDTVATCSMMVRTSILPQIGIMPEDNFIYWDDMEWGYRCQLAGYKVAVTKSSVVLHRMGAKKVSVNTFPTYYMWRNWIFFFIRYVKEEDLEHFSYIMLKAVFQSIYESMYRGEHHLRETILYAYDDAIHGIRGKASPGKIFDADRTPELLNLLLQKHWEKDPARPVRIFENGYQKEAQALFTRLKEGYPEHTVTIEKEQKETQTKGELSLHLCDYIFNLTEAKLSLAAKSAKPDGSLGCVFIDTSLTPVSTMDELSLVKSYGLSQQVFLYTSQPLFLHCAKTLRKKLS